MSESEQIPKVFDFHTAIELMFKGHRVRRTGWPKGANIDAANNQDDWELFQEPETEREP